MYVVYLFVRRMNVDAVANGGGIKLLNIKADSLESSLRAFGRDTNRGAMVQRLSQRKEVFMQGQSLKVNIQTVEAGW